MKQSLRRWAMTGAVVCAASLPAIGLMTVPAVYQADGCGDVWYWNANTNSCVPNGFPSDPPNGCINASGSHLNGNICAS